MEWESGLATRVVKRRAKMRRKGLKAPPPENSASVCVEHVRGADRKKIPPSLSAGGGQAHQRTLKSFILSRCGSPKLW